MSNNLSGVGGAMPVRIISNTTGVPVYVVNSNGVASEIVASQEGSTSEGVPLTLIQATPAGTGTLPVFQIQLGGATFDGVSNPVVYYGWNTNSGGSHIDSSMPRTTMNYEANWEDGGIRWTEFYLEYMPATSVGSFNLRPFFIGIRHDADNAYEAAERVWMSGKNPEIHIPDQAGVDQTVAQFSGTTVQLNNPGAALVGSNDLSLNINASATGLPFLKFQAGGVTTSQVHSGDGTMFFTVGDKIPLQFYCGANFARVGINIAPYASLDLALRSADNGYGIRVAQAPVVAAFHDMLFLCANDGSTVLSRADRNGVLMTRKTAVANGDLEPGEVGWLIDSTNGAGKVVFKGKEADGTVFTVTLNKD